MSQESSYLMGKNNHKHDDGSLKILYNCRLVMLMILMMMRRRNLDDDLFNRIGIRDESFQKHNSKNPLPRRSSLFRPLLFQQHISNLLLPLSYKQQIPTSSKSGHVVKKNYKGPTKNKLKTAMCLCFNNRAS